MRRRRLQSNERGNVAMLFALALVPLLLGVGVAIDMVRANTARSALQAAADAAALAGGGSGKPSEDEIRAVAAEYLKANGAADSVSSLNVTNISTDPSTGKFRVELQGSVTTTFMAIAGYSSYDVGVVSEVKRGSSGPLEMVLVLDTTYSMASSDKIGTLKTAASNMVKSVMGTGNTKVGVVPFADYLNISKDYVGKPWLTVPADITDTFESCTWDYPYKTGCTIRTTCYNDGVPYSCNVEECTDWGTPVKSNCSTVTYVYKFEGCIKSRPEPYLASISDPTAPTYEGTTGSVCGSPILEMTTNKTDVLNRIDALSPSGNTYIPSGLVWGWNMLTPEEPLTAAESMATIAAKGGKKALVLMTDGENTVAPRKGDLMFYGFYDAGYGMDSTEIDAVTASLCEKIKAEGTIVYTVAFDVTASNIKNLLQGCASDPAKAFVADDAAGLLAAFKNIGSSLTQLRLVR